MSYIAFHGMSDKFFFVNEEGKAEVAYIETFSMELFWQGREVPCLQPMSTKLNRFHSFHFGLFNEVFNIFFCHTMMLIVEQELLLIISIPFLFFLRYLLLLFVDLVGVNFEELLWYPSIISSINT